MAHQQQQPPKLIICSSNAQVIICFLFDVRTGCQFLVEGGSAATLWLQTRPPCDAWLVSVTLNSARGNIFPTFGSTTRELNFGGQMFSHTFRQRLSCRNRLVVNYAGWFLTQIQTDFLSLLLTIRHSKPATSTKSKLTSKLRRFYETFHKSRRSAAAATASYSRRMVSRLPCPTLKGRYLQIPGPSEFLRVIFTRCRPAPPAADEPDEEKCSFCLGEGSTGCFSASKKGSSQRCHSSASIPNCSAPAEYQFQQNPHRSRADAVGEQGAALVSSHLLQQGTELIQEEVLHL